jgi:CheY-like chemotaxis protein
VFPHAHIVLVVDDDEAARDALTFFLGGRGYDAKGASGGEDALRKLAEGLVPCAIVTDVAMPGMCGWAFLDALRGDPELASIPVIVLSGRSSDARALRPGVHKYLTKPVEPGLIGDAVAECCPRRSAS